MHTQLGLPEKGRAIKRLVYRIYILFLNIIVNLSNKKLIIFKKLFIIICAQVNIKVIIDIPEL